MKRAEFSTELNTSINLKIKTMEDLKLLKEHLKELKVKMAQHQAIRNRIEVEQWKDTKRLLSIGITNLETAILYFKEAIEEQERQPAKRYA